MCLSCSKIKLAGELDWCARVFLNLERYMIASTKKSHGNQSHPPSSTGSKEPYAPVQATTVKAL